MSTLKTPDSTSGLPPVALIAGPTASGKSDLAVRLAEKLGARGGRAVVLNADSAQVYADLQVLSARPSSAEMRGVEHRLFGAWDGATACSAADWAAAAVREIDALHAEGAVPILCGGTGLYLRTLLEGIAPIPEIESPIREAVRAMPQDAARAALEQEDPAAAARLAPADSARTCRALEVIRSTGRTLAQWQQEKQGGIGHRVCVHGAVLLPERSWLYERCDRRFRIMLEQGAEQEVQALLARSLDPALPVMRAIGVAEITALLQGDLSPDQAIASGQTATRQYAKRQYTWFRHQTPRDWGRYDNKITSVEDIFVSLFRYFG